MWTCYSDKNKILLICYELLTFDFKKNIILGENNISINKEGFYRKWKK